MPPLDSINQAVPLNFTRDVTLIVIHVLQKVIWTTDTNFPDL